MPNGMVASMEKVSRAVILAAGIGSRLKSLTLNKPKALMPIQGEPAIGHVVRQLVAQGVQHIAINLHHHPQQLKDYLGYGASFNAHFYFSSETELLDSGGGVRTALQLLPGDGLCAVYNADIMSDINVHTLAQQCPEHGCALALVTNPKHNPLGDFSLQQQQVITRQQESYTFAGVSVWHNSALTHYPTQTAFSLIQPIRTLIKKERCSAVVHHGQWFDIGRPRDLIQANRLLRS